jgi:hypothetical protein
MHIPVFLLFCALLPLHPIHLSVTEIYENKKSGRMELSATLFMDDFARAIHYENYEKQIRQGKVKPEDLMLRYLREKLRIQVNGQPAAFRLLRTENNMDAVTCYLGVEPAVKSVQRLYIENRIFLELFDDQRNMVQIDLGENRSGAVQFDHKKTSAAIDL